MSEFSVLGQFDCAVGAGSVTVKNSTSGAPVREYNIAQRFWNAHIRSCTMYVLFGAPCVRPTILEILCMQHI